MRHHTSVLSAGFLIAASFCGHSSYAASDDDEFKCSGTANKDMTYQAGMPSSLSAAVNIEHSVTTCNEDGSLCITEAQGGAGAVIDDTKKLIVTNYHVVDSMIRDKKDMVIQFVNPNTLEKSEGAFEANVIGYDIAQDIAVLQMVSDFTPPCVMLSDAPAQISEEVSFIGTPAGVFELSTGHILAKDIESFASLQLDAKIAVGYSGSVIVNEHGEGVGVVHGFLGERGDLQGDITVAIDTLSATESINKILRDNATISQSGNHNTRMADIHAPDDLGL